MPPPLLPLPHLSSFAINSVDFLAVRLLSLADEDVADASLLTGSFLRRLAIVVISKIQHCRCRSPPSSSPPPSSRRFLPSASSPSPTRMSLPPLFFLVLSFVSSPSPPLFSLVLFFVGSPSSSSPRSNAVVADLLSLPLLHRPAAASCRPPPLPRRRGCRYCLSSLWFFPLSARHRRHPQDSALSLQISSLFLSSTIQPPLLAVHLLSLANKDVTAASLLSGSFLSRLLSPPLFSLVLSFVVSPSPPSPRSSAAVADLLPLPLLHRPAAASCSSLAMPLLLASSPLSTFSFSVDLYASSSSAFRHCRLPIFRPHPVHG